jgi:hypothetical protein
MVPTEATEDKSNNYWPNHDYGVRKQAWQDRSQGFSGLILFLPKKKEARILLAILLVLVAGLSIYIAYPRIVATKVSSISAGIASSPTSWNGRALHVFGSVVDRGDNEITIADGTGSIKVAWSGTLPGIGTSNVLAHGILKVESSAQASFQIVADSLTVWPV